MNNPLAVVALALLGAIMLGGSILGACLVLVRYRFWREYLDRKGDRERRTPERITFDEAREIWVDRPIPRTPPGRAFDAADRDAEREFWQAPPFTSRPKR